MDDIGSELSQYVAELNMEKVDAEIRGVPFTRQEELDRLEEWAHSIPDNLFTEDNNEIFS